MSQFHVVSRRIDNSRVVRFGSPGQMRELLQQVGIGILLAGVIFAYAWQHFQCVQLGYQVESLKSQQGQLTELNRKLTLEVAGLRSPQRIDQIARRLGLDAPAAGQVQLTEAPAEPIFAEVRSRGAERIR